MTASGSGTHTYPAPQAPDDRLTPPVDASAPGPKARRKSRVVLVAVLIGCLAAAGAWVLLSPAGGAAGATDLGPTVVVTRGPLLYSVTESGEVEAERRKVIANELRYPAMPVDDDVRRFHVTVHDMTLVSVLQRRRDMHREIHRPFYRKPSFFV